MPRNPESSSAVAVYRRAIPLGLRHRIDSAVPVRARQRVKAALAVVPVGALRASVTGRIHRALHPGFHRGTGRVSVRIGSTIRVAHVADGLTTLSARQANLDLVVGALEAADIDYFVVRGDTDSGSTIAIESSSVAAACRELSSLARESAGYWSWARDGENPQDVSEHAGTTPFASRKGQGVQGVRLFWFRSDPRQQLVLGAPFSCEVQFWTRKSGQLVTASRNRVTQEVEVEAPVVQAPGELFTRLASAHASPLPPVRTRSVFTAQRPEDVAFPVDVVYTWVDGADERWREKRAATLHEPYHADAANESRYVNRDELRYSLRSLAMYAPWVRHVYLVTDDQVPSWLDTAGEGLTVVDHREIFTDPTALPTFNSHAIESQLHHIEGLSEHFLYLNDDMLFGAPVTPEDFFYANGVAQHFPSPANVPAGAASDLDVPVAVAAKNNRALIEQHFGTVLTQKMKHAPYALRRSVLAEIEKEFEAQHQATASHSVRDRGDLSIASSLHHYYAFETGRSVPGRIRYKYIDLAKADAARLMGLVLADRRWQAMCLNSTTDTDQEVSTATLVGFLESYYPVPSRFER